jgi:hypothetical protein
VLLVERSVARAAQEELLTRGISLVHHTKPELLERLGRCMGVKVCVLHMHTVLEQQRCVITSAGVPKASVCLHCARAQVAASVEELSPAFVGSCSRFNVELLPQPDAAAAPGGNGGSGAAEPAAAGGPLPGLAAAAAAAAGVAAPRPGGARPTPVSATPAPPKTLMVFEGCPLPLGCTVLLHGASPAELTKLKRVVKLGLLAAYHLGLETAFVAEELALATAALAPEGACVAGPHVCACVLSFAVRSLRAHCHRPHRRRC